MLFNFLRGQRGERLERLEQIESKVQTMLRHDRHEFDLAMAALLGDRVAAEVRPELRATDQKVNQLEREIRRELVVHASVLGGIESPAVLLYMSVVKDVERVGDYAKNLVDLARDGANFSQIPQAEAWRRLWTEISQSIAATGQAFEARDRKRSRDLHARGNALLNLFDERVSALVRDDETADQAVARALAYRYLKRVVAHLMNILTSVTMPLDRLDYSE